jgi:hypothetical protein
VRNFHFTRFLALAAAVFALAGMGMAQGTYHLKVVPESQPTGPNQIFYAKLVLVEHTTDVSGFDINIGYDNSRADFLGASDNAAQPGTNPFYSRGAHEVELTGVSYANVYRLLLMDTAPNSLLPPTDPAAEFKIGRLQFQTSADYDTADGEFGIYLFADNDGGVSNGNIAPIPVTYISYVPGSAVSDWAMY